MGGAVSGGANCSVRSGAMAGGEKPEDVNINPSHDGHFTHEQRVTILGGPGQWRDKIQQTSHPHFIKSEGPWPSISSEKIKTIIHMYTL